MTEAPAMTVKGWILTTAAPETVAALAAASTTNLLTTAYALTHRLHDAETCVSSGRRRGDYADELRRQRDMITAELERRTAAYETARAAGLFIDTDGHEPTVWQADTAPGGEPLALTDRHQLRNAGPVWGLLEALLPAADLPPAQ